MYFHTVIPNWDGKNLNLSCLGAQLQITWFILDSSHCLRKQLKSLQQAWSKMPFFLTAQFTYLCFTTHYTLSDFFYSGQPWDSVFLVPIAWLGAGWPLKKVCLVLSLNINLVLIYSSQLWQNSPYSHLEYLSILYILKSVSFLHLLK